MWGKQCAENSVWRERCVPAHGGTWFPGNLQYSHLALSPGIPTWTQAVELSRVQLRSAEIQREFWVSGTDPVVSSCEIFPFLEIGQEISGSVISMMRSNLCVTIIIIRR